MTVDIFETTQSGLRRKLRLTQWDSLLWRPQYNQLGSFSVEVAYSKEVLQKIRPMDILTSDFDDTAMIAVSVEVKNKKIIVTGHSAVYILTKRVSTKVISNEDAEEALNTLIGEMKPWPSVASSPTFIQGLNIPYSATTSDGTLFDYCNQIGASVDMGFRFSRNLIPNMLTFQCYRPGINDKVRFSAVLGNMGNEARTESEADYANFAVVAGDGEGDNRVQVTAFVGATEPMGSNRRETYIDGKAIRRGIVKDEDGAEHEETLEEYEERLRLYGLGKLLKRAKIDNYTFEISDESVKLGDLVKITPECSDVVIVARVNSISIKSQNNTFKKTISIGTPVPIGKRG